MKFTTVLVAGLATAQAAEEPKKYARGYRRMNSNAVKKVAVITDEMRAAAPASLDWAAKGALTPVKDQGQCGSCWAYSATEGIEAGLYMATGQKIKLSEQQIISCDKEDLGCDGGDLPSAFDYVKSNGGIDTQSDYPDTSSNKGKDGKCKKNADKVVKVTDYEYAIPPCKSGGSCKNQKESDMMAALNTYGPLSVCVNAEDWDGYSSGIYKKKCSGKEQSLDHCVQLVGYDTTGSQSYWKVRNSWASDWGEEGFIRLPMGENACGIADEAMYVKAEMVSLEADDKHCHIEEDAGMSKVVVDDIFNCTVNFQGTCTDCRAVDATSTSGGHQVSCKAGDGNWYNANCPELAASSDKHCHIEQDAGMSKVVADDIFECTVNFQGTCTDCRATDATATSGGHQVSCKAGDGNWYSANCPTSTFTV